MRAQQQSSDSSVNVATHVLPRCLLQTVHPASRVPCGLNNYNLSAATAKSLQLCPTQCDPIDGSPPGSPVPGILQARTLEWVAISFRSEERRVGKEC